MRKISSILLAVALSSVGTSHAGGLVLHLTFDDLDQSTAPDVTGNGHDGLLVNMDPLTDSIVGPSGMALDFDGADDYVEVADHLDLSFGRRCFSVSYWVNKLQTAAGYDNLYGVSKWRTGASPGTNEWVLNVGTGIDEDRPTFLVEVGGTVYGALSPTPITLGEWHHLVGVRSGNTVRLYVDGVLMAVNDTLPGDAEMNDTGVNLRIAVNQPPAPLFYTRGQFDDLQVYDFPLDDGGVGVGEVAGGDIAFLFANPGASLARTDPVIGGVPDGSGIPGTPLQVSKEAGGDVTLDWDPACIVDNFTDYSVYEGEIGDFTSHVPRRCSTLGALTTTLTPAFPASYYLVVPRNGCYAGSYGTDGSGAPRVPSTSPCASGGQDSCSP